MPADPAQLKSQIRFALEQLSERNAQHDWEHLCRHLTVARICANVLPATGPVQAGGDQGRDFETFRTYLKRHAATQGVFLGLVSERPLAFACTLERKIASKVRSDVVTIVSEGTPVEGIYFFCSRDLPVAKRHDLQQWAESTYGVHLEILDGQAIAELLTGADTFWIAVRFLHLPADLLPVPPAEEGEWYTHVLEKWRQAPRSAQTVADLVEIRAAARAALGPFAYDEDRFPRHQYERPELPFWIDRLDELAEHGALLSVRRRALYEASVLRLRGIGTLRGQELHLRTYFAAIPRLDDANELEDTEVLLSYVSTAAAQGLVQLRADELEAWFQALEQRLDARLQAAAAHRRINQRCALLEVRGHLALFRNLPRGQGGMDATAAFAYWSELAELAAQAPLFPLEQFADRLAEYARFIGTHPAYEPLTTALDALVAERSGQFKVAEKCLERAKVFRTAGDLPRAMAQLHHAKIDWFAEEALGRALLALQWLSMAYEEQGLLFAAKYYALVGAFVALHTDDLRLKSAIAPCLVSAAECSYAMGAWHGYLELAAAAALCYPQFARDPDADAANPESMLNHLLFNVGLIRVATKYLHPSLLPFVREGCREVAARLDLVDVMDEVAESADSFWAARGSDALWQAMQEQLAGPPWSDAGMERHAQWKAHGVTWNVTWANTYEMTVVAEEFLSALQIVLSDLAGYDLCLMRTTVHMSLRLALAGATGLVVRADEGGDFEVDFAPSNAERRAIITLPPYARFRDGKLTHQDLQIGALSVASALLCEVSLLPDKQFHDVLDERFAQGLPNKLHIGAPYGQCFQTFVTAEEFDASERVGHVAPALGEAFTSQRPERLRWVDGPGPGYSEEEAREQLTNRYERFARPVQYTLRRLARESEFQQTLARLRASGWKDWHVLAAVFHVTINYRLQHRRILLPSAEAERAATERLISQSEPEDAAPVPVSEYTEKALRQHLNIYMGSFASTYGLEMHQRTPDISALDDFLAHRYGFWTDDVEHDELFPEVASPA